MIKLKTLTTCGLLVFMSTTACAVDSTSEERPASEAELLVVATKDFNNDGLKDLVFKTVKDGAYTDTMLLNQGNQVFQWLNAASTQSGELPYGSDAWVDRGVHALSDLHNSVAALSASLEQLPDSSMVDLGLQKAGDTARDWSQCPEHWYCMWQHSDFTGAFYGSSLNGCRTASSNVGWFNDRASSIMNRSGCYVCYYEHANYAGKWSYLNPLDSIKYFWEFNDKISSWATFGSGVACRLW